MRTGEHILITRGAGTIDSLISAEQLRSDTRVSVVDNHLSGGDWLRKVPAHATKLGSENGNSTMVLKNSQCAARRDHS